MHAHCVLYSYGGWPLSFYEVRNASVKSIVSRYGVSSLATAREHSGGHLRLRSERELDICHSLTG